MSLSNSHCNFHMDRIVVVFLRIVIFDCCATILIYVEQYNVWNVLNQTRCAVHGLNWSLPVVFGVDNFFPAHSTYPLFICTSLTVMRTRLMNRTLTNSTFFEICVWIKSVFFWGQGFIFTNFSPATFCCISCPRFPWIGCNYFSQLFLTLFTNHLADLNSVK